MSEIIIFLTIGFVLDVIFIFSYYRNQYLQVLIFKTLSSAFFVLLAIVLCVKYNNTALSWLVVCGTIFGLMGDFFLDASPVLKKIEKNAFLLGFGSFFIGHLFYICRTAVLLGKAGSSWNILAAFVIAMAAGTGVIKAMLKICKPSDEILKVGIAYLLTIDFSCMLAWTLWMNANGSLFLAFGTLLFAISDHMLVVDYFGFHKVEWLHGALLILYYMAQCFIVISILY